MGWEGSYWDMRLHILFVNLAAVVSSVPKSLHTRTKELCFDVKSTLGVLFALFGNIVLGLSYLISYYPGNLEKSETHQKFI